MKFVLILMVKNESKILERCLKSAEEFVDAFCIHDTGSTDNTCEIAKEFLKTRKGCLTTSQWTDFGTNRSVSFSAAQSFVTNMLKWDLNTTYGLLLDGDMVFVPGLLKTHPLGETGYTILQTNGNLEYPNCRLVRMDYMWKCKGVTHEYWDGHTAALPKSVCYIDDRNDGGCKSDKFERDARLLEKGLLDEPDNVRYMFYLAQTYHSLGRWKDSIAMYKKRIAAGGWIEEQWYSMYMIAQSYLTLGEPIKFESWLLRAYSFRPGRAEAMYKLVRYFRENSQHYKAYQYLEFGHKIPLSTDSLFIEKDVYEYLFDYERSILDYYVVPDRMEGVRSSLQVLLKTDAFRHNVLSNLVFYAQPIGTHKKLNLPSPFGEKYRPSAISVGTYPFANVRYVNYWMEKGEYKTKDNENVHTENAYINLETNEVLMKMDELSVGLPKRDVRVRGLEDVRLYDNKFTATVQEFDEHVRVLQGTYDATTGRYNECKVLPSPNNRQCEKNWLPIPGKNAMIYDWCPFQIIGDVEKTYQTPPFFQMLRGSAPPFLHEGDWWALTHFVEYSSPRKYYHCFVRLDQSYKPIFVSLPFVFSSASVEYCISCRPLDDTIECYVSFMDSNPAAVQIQLSDLEWISI